LGIAARAAGALAGFEGAEANQLNLVACGEGFSVSTSRLVKPLFSEILFTRSILFMFG
jgi:hypothetical protein